VVGPKKKRLLTIPVTVQKRKGKLTAETKEKVWGDYERKNLKREAIGLDIKCKVLKRRFPKERKEQRAGVGRGNQGKWQLHSF